MRVNVAHAEQGPMRLNRCREGHAAVYYRHEIDLVTVKGHYADLGNGLHPPGSPQLLQLNGHDLYPIIFNLIAEVQHVCNASTAAVAMAIAQSANST